MKTMIPFLLLALTTPVFAQDEQTQNNTTTTEVVSDVAINDGIVTIASKGSSVRDVLYDLFQQSKHNFVLEPNTHFVLYLSLSGVEFEEALNIVCTVSNLEYSIQNDIYFIGKQKSGKVDMTKPIKVEIPDPKPQPKRGKLTTAEMNARMTTRFAKTEITKVFASITEQTGIEIIVDKDVPLYRIDAYLIDTSVQYAMDVIIRATGLKYTLTEDKQIQVSKKS